MSSSESGQRKKEISVILAIRNEEAYVSKCLDSLLNQDLGQEKYEIIVVDGMSDDKTREVIATYREKYPALIKILDNDKKNPAAGRNLGIRHANSRIIVILSGHAYVGQGHLSTFLKTFSSVPSDVAGIGTVVLSPDDDTESGKIMSDVQNTLIGGLGTGHIRKTRTEYVNSITFSAYKKEVLDKVGLYDDKFLFCEDIELDWRIRRAGFKLITSHEAEVYYYRKHRSLRLMFTKNFNYGKWRAIFYRKYPNAVKPLFFVPSIILLSIALLPVFTFVYLPLACVISTGLAIYLAAILGSTFYLTAKRNGPKYLISFPMYLTIHFGFAAGFLVGLLGKMPRQDSTVEQTFQMSLS